MNYFWNLLKNLDKVLIIIPIIFAALSITMLASIEYQGQFVFSQSMKMQLISYCVGFAAMTAALFVDYHFYLKFERAIYIVSVVFLLSVRIPGLGHEEFGGARWIYLGVTTFQPSEIVKISMILLAAMYISRNRDSLKTFKGVALSFLYVLPFILIVLLEDLGSAIVMGFAWVFMVFYAGINYKLFLKLSTAVVFSVPIIYRFLGGSQRERIDAFLNPDNLKLQGVYQVLQSKIAIGSGGIFGKGLFAGTQKEFKFLPVQKSDFIFSVIVEELGLLGGAVLIFLYTVFLYRIVKIAYNAKDLYGALIAMGFIGMFLFQIFQNIAMTMGLMPVTGVTLPFISSGGSSILSCMIAVGFVLNIGIRNKIINF